MTSAKKGTSEALAERRSITQVTGFNHTVTFAFPRSFDLGQITFWIGIRLRSDKRRSLLATYKEN